jgi:parallel beta-helix repeat protein
VLSLAGRRSIVSRARAAHTVAFFIVLAPACSSTRATVLRSGAEPLMRSAVACTRYASPSGRKPDRSVRYRSVQALVDSLRPGQTGCLKPGLYRENVVFRRGGSGDARRITLSGAPGGRAVLLGTVEVVRGANFVTISDLHLNGRVVPGIPSPQVNGNHVTLRNLDVTNEHTGICIVVGGAAGTFGTAWHTKIERSRIHDCGRLPPRHFDHGIYLAHSRYATITDTYIYDNADWGIHLFPDAQNSTIQHNVVDGNGSGLIVAGTGDLASSGNHIAYNVVSNSTDRSALGRRGNNYGYNLTSFWGPVVGARNVVTHNCVWGGASGNVNAVNGGFSASDNVEADPMYVSRVAKDFRLRPGSPCAGDGPRST